MSPLVEQVSVDEAYVDLAAVPDADLTVEGVSALAQALRHRIRTETGGLTASVGIGSSKLVAKIASELDKPDGLTVVAPGTELATLHPLPVRRLGGVGPATAERLRRLRVETIGDLAAVAEDDLVSLLGQAHGTGLHRLSLALDDRPVVPEREAKSVSAEETFSSDLTDPARLRAEIERLAERVGSRLRAASTYGRTVTLKVRRYDFSTLTRSSTLSQSTDAPRQLASPPSRCCATSTSPAGCGCSGSGCPGCRTTCRTTCSPDPAERRPGGSRRPRGPRGRHWHRGKAFGAPGAEPAHRPDGTPPPHRTSPSTGRSTATPASSRCRGRRRSRPSWRPGQDVSHREHGAGWVWGSGRGLVTVRFEGPMTTPGPVRTFARGRPRPASRPTRRSAHLTPSPAA